MDWVVYGLSTVYIKVTVVGFLTRIPFRFSLISVMLTQSVGPTILSSVFDKPKLHRGTPSPLNCVRHGFRM